MIRQLVSRHHTLLYYFSFSMATSVIGFVAALVLIRLITPVEYGRIALFNSVMFFSAPLISLSAENLIAVNKAKLGPIGYEHFRKTYITLSYLIFGSLQLVVLAALVAGLVPDPLFMLLPICGLVRFLISVASLEYILEQRAVRYGLIGLGSSLCSLFLSVLFLRVFTPTAKWRILALLITDLLFLLVRHRGRLRLLSTISIDSVIFRQIATFGFPLLLSLAPAWLLNESDKIVVARVTDIATVGYYAAAASIVGVIFVFHTAVINVLTPRIYAWFSSRPDQAMEAIGYYFRRFVMIAFVFAVVFAATYHISAAFVLPAKYAQGRAIVYVLIAFSFGRTLYAVLGLSADYFGMTVEKLIGIVAGGLTTISVSWFMVNRLGVIGAAAGVGCGYLVLSAVLWIALLRRQRAMHQLCGAHSGTLPTIPAGTT